MTTLSLAKPKIYLVRHATPDWSRTDIRYDIPPGPPLVAQGEAEAASLGEFLRTVEAYKIYVSPLERTLRTAQIAAEIAQLPVFEEEAIAEWRRGESEQQVLERLMPFWDKISQESQENGPIVMVSHGGPVRAMLQHLKLDQAEIDFYRKQFDRDNPVPPAGAWLATQARFDDRWQLHLAFTPQPHKVYTPPLVYV
ncbi:MAG: histidine phosphatase family protein [Chloroflexi bacterium]|nr:histidine phosphatase family protein [Chloroflexota bacterium]